MVGVGASGAVDGLGLRFFFRFGEGDALDLAAEKRTLSDIGWFNSNLCC